MQKVSQNQPFHLQISVGSLLGRRRIFSVTDSSPRQVLGAIQILLLTAVPVEKSPAAPSP